MILTIYKNKLLFYENVSLTKFFELNSFLVDDDEQRKQVEEVMRGELDNWSPDSTAGSIHQ